MEDYVNVRNTSSTYRRKVASFKQLNRILGKRDFDSITPACVHTYVRRRKEGGASNSTINRDLAALKHMFQYAVQCGATGSNPLHHFKNLKEPLKAVPRYSKEEVEKVIGAVRVDCQPIFIFIRETGCRLEEALSLEHSQLDFQQRFVVFTHKTKAGRYRIVPLTAAAAEAAKALPRLENCPYVFYNVNSQTRWHNCRKPWVDARKSAGVPGLRVKDLRSHYAIGLAESGADMHDIRQVLGHSTVAVTERHYAQFSPRHSGKRILRILEGGRSEELTRNQRQTA
jgi:site-specific recombinase XerD